MSSNKKFVVAYCRPSREDKDIIGIFQTYIQAFMALQQELLDTGRSEYMEDITKLHITYTQKESTLPVTCYGVILDNEDYYEITHVWFENI